MNWQLSPQGHIYLFVNDLGSFESNIMVLSRRRSRSAYSILLRHHGRTIRDESDKMKVEKLAVLFLILWGRNNFNRALSLQYKNMAIVCLLHHAWYTRFQLLKNPTFNYNPMRLIDHPDDDLYDMRITKCSHIPRILHAVRFPILRMW